MSITILHNPRCSTSRRTLELLKKNGISPQVRLYLEEPPTAKEIKKILDLLGIEAKDLLRTKEEIYKNLVAKEGKPNNSKALTWMTKYPILIERPIVLSGKMARLGRPPEQVLEIVNGY